MSSDKMFPQIPFILDNFVAHCAGDPLTLYMNIDNVLFQIEAVAERFPAVVTESRLHTSPPIPWVSWGQCLRTAASWICGGRTHYRERTRGAVFRSNRTLLNRYEFKTRDANWW